MAGDVGGTRTQEARRRRWRAHVVPLCFIAPAGLLLGIWLVYPVLFTVVRSFFDRSGEHWIGVENYVALFTSDFLVTAIKNNALWVAVVPAAVTALGLILAVLTERISWAAAFRLVVFMPMAISLFTTGVVWRLVYEKDPGRGALNAAIAAGRETLRPAGELAEAAPSTDAVRRHPGGGLALTKNLTRGDVALLGLTQLPTEDVPESAADAFRPVSLPTGISGVVWRDFRPGGGTPGIVERGELGLPAITVELRDKRGGIVSQATTAADGTFAFDEVSAGVYTVTIAAQNFARPFGGISWLGASLITPAIMIAYTWVWTGFALVVIAAGLAVVPRELLEAARLDGASENQVLRHITVPLLAPVLTAVFVTMLINVLKVFDVVLAIAPGSVQDDANVIALAMWRTAFGGKNDFGLGSAIAVLLFVLVLPSLFLNMRRFRREV
ncbi:MAG: ABC transporter permease subunit [Actinobacteria bacterium]|nr:ABC transporter permease subunit [Actinomycetota bacterium]